MNISPTIQITDRDNKRHRIAVEYIISIIQLKKETRIRLWYAPFISTTVDIEEVAALVQNSGTVLMKIEDTAQGKLYIQPGCIVNIIEEKKGTKIYVRGESGGHFTEAPFEQIVREYEYLCKK